MVYPLTGSRNIPHRFNKNHVVSTVSLFPTGQMYLLPLASGTHDHLLDIGQGHSGARFPRKGTLYIGSQFARTRSMEAETRDPLHFSLSQLSGVEEPSPKLTRLRLRRVGTKSFCDRI